MAVSDFLSDVGGGLATTGRVLGAIGGPLAQSIGNEEAGYAPAIAAQNRAHDQAMEDAEIEAKVKDLENQMALGQKYGTLTPEDHDQYMHAISQLYSNPRHAPALMEKLRQIIHPNGATYTPPAPVLKSAVPTGGTAAADLSNAQDLAQARYQAMRRNNPKLSALDNFTQENYGVDYNSAAPDQQEKALGAYVRANSKASPGKNYQIPGSQLPVDAIGPDNKPIDPTLRDINHNFMEYNGAWWPVPKPNPIYKPNVAGWDVLLDPQTMQVIKKIGPHGQTKITAHDSQPFPDDNGQMRTVKLYSVSTPQGANIDVDMDPNGVAQAALPEDTKPSSGSSTGAKKGVASSLQGGKSTAAAPVNPANVGGSLPGRVLPGFTMLANSKSPVYKADVAQYTKASEDTNSKQESYESAKSAFDSGPTPSSDQSLIYSWVRSNVQGAGRMTQVEFKMAASIGSLPQRAQNWYEMATKGTLTPEIRSMMMDDIKRSYDTSRAVSDGLRKRLETSPSAPAASGTSGALGGTLADRLNKALGGK
jgi:hypothetical protein